MRDKSKVVRTALRAAKRRRYDIGGVADPYGVVDPEEELRRKNQLYQNTGDFSLFNQQPYDPSKDQQTPGPNTNAGQLFAGGPFSPTNPFSNDLVSYNNANYQPGAVQSASLAPPANTVDPFSAYITGALAGIPATPSSPTPAFVSTPFTPDPVTPSQPATRGITIADEEVPTTPVSTPTQVAALTPATTPNQMFSDSGKFTGRIGDPLPGSLLPAFAETKGMMAAYGNLADTFAANQAATPTSAEVNQSLPGAVTGQNLVGSFDPLASQDILGDVSHGVFGLSGPTGLSNAMQQTDEQVSEQEAQQEAEQAAAEQAAAEQAAAEQAAAEQAAAEQAAAEQAAQQQSSNEEESPGGGDGGGAPEAGDSGPDEKRGGRIGYPLAKEGKDKLTYMKPKKFLAKARSLSMDKDDRTTIDKFKSAIKKGQSLDPLALYPHNRENGRHRAMAAKELGIKKVPVHNYRNEARGGSIVDKALMLTSRRLAAAKAPK